MSQAYRDPSRASDPYSIPNVETFEIRDGKDADGFDTYSETGDPLDDGWYWQACFPGCMPDGEPIGPFETEEEAIASASTHGIADNE